MRLFFLKLFLFIAPIVVLYSILYNLGYNPVLTNSISFDAKIEEVSKRKIKQVDIMVTGSSVALNDLNSKVMQDSFKQRYYNFSAWGLKIGDTYDMLINNLDVIKPKYVIIPSTIADFNLGPNTSLTGVKFGYKFMPFYYFKKFSNLPGIIKRKQMLSDYTKNTQVYESLKFDYGGGVALDIPNQAVDYGRLSAIKSVIDGFPGTYLPKAYKTLDSLAMLLYQKHIKLIFIQSPIQNFSSIAKTKQTILRNYFSECKLIVEKHKGTYLNYSDNLVINNTLYVDALHLSATGSVVFTKVAARDMASIIH